PTRAHPVSRIRREAASRPGCTSPGTTLTPSFRRPWKPRRGAESRAPARSSPTSQQALLLAVPFALLDRCALVVLLLALGEPQIELDATFAEMQVERHERVTRPFHLANEPVDLATMEEQLAG